MAELWARKIKEKQKTFDEVPSKLQEKVKEILIKDGYSFLFN
jgi:hypothetical protein